TPRTTRSTAAMRATSRTRTGTSGKWRGIRGCCRRSDATSAEAAGDVVLGLLALRLDEDAVGVAVLDQLAQVQVRGVVGDARSLLHVVRDEHHGVVVLQLGDQLLDAR